VGKAAHAGGAPHLGVNALYAATVGLGAINAIRETFRDEDTIRVHPIITHGGSQVNVIPGDVRLETYVRGRSVEAILDAERKVDRAFKAGALALGATVEIETLPGYLPMQCDPIMARYFRETAVDILGPGGQLLRQSPHARPDVDWAREFLWSRAGTIYSGSSEIQRNIIAKRVLNLPQDPR
jgi:metal-dependent amidase/aminoacylase/carboxypeptidase family protein